MNNANEAVNGDAGAHAAADRTRDNVAEYYGKVLQKSSDLKTNACCTDEEMPSDLKRALANIADEVMIKYYGCGLIRPEALEGLTVLDLGCGAGRDVYALAQFVGEHGKVIGVDMTEEQISVAQKYVKYHAEKFGFARPNTEFRHGFIERLDEAGIESESVDVIVSNCVVNLSPDKRAVLEQAYRVLKQGGEMYFSDVYALRRVPKELAEDPVLFGECLSGALYYNDFLRLAHETGFLDPRVVKSSPITIENDEIQARVGAIRFVSVTYRLFKLGGLEHLCEDYGQAVRYKGTIAGFPHMFKLDNHHAIETGKIFPVCGNTWCMLKGTRFEPHFEFFGDFSTHFGVFEGCGEDDPFGMNAPVPLGNGSCC
ncbi:Arsenite methyltransferase [Porphyridium purpureum]|uniref:Arsenite methyltransferase n=1 Tax=Porphyridium purpureum TaxID=35688 RepID=A0A5J4Z7S1_PORPP|nr:Arsenite methyltransferase [Porphyridium purpureum]|eukprot:POR9385..scf295_1